jgi:cation diffusion facilitator CzcD-associated flavoprotein CzcO
VNSPESRTDGGPDGSIRHVDVVVVGSGFSGLYMVHKIRQLGLTLQAFEAGSDVGGTWYWNRYPGARCDSESFCYSYRFDEDLQQEWHWTERYPAQPEILSYLRHVADRFDLRRSFQFNTRVVSAAFDEAVGRWAIETDAGRPVTATYLVTAVGNLSVPNRPDVPGLDRFTGRWYHTGRWPGEGVNLAGARVGVIGTGSSGVQIVPVLAESVAALTVFQRTPQYMLPAQNRPMDEETEREWKSHYRERRELERTSADGTPFPTTTDSVLEATPDERHARFEEWWRVGGFRFMHGTYADLTSSLEANQFLADYVRSKTDEIVRDPATAALLKPTDYPMGAKRIPLTNGYYEAYNRDNVHLVDVLRNPVREVTESGILLEDGTLHELDVIVFATGYDAITGPLLAMDIHGRGGQRLADKWKAGPRSYLAAAVAGFPNLFTVVGPGGPAAVTNVPPSIEQHVEWIAGFLGYFARREMPIAEAAVAAEDAWCDEVSREAAKTLYPYARTSWYMGSNVPGKPRVFMAYTGGLNRFTRICDEVAADGYRGFQLTDPVPLADCSSPVDVSS